MGHFLFMNFLEYGSQTQSFVCQIALVYHLLSFAKHDLNEKNQIACG